jgi:hypothetical protein
VVLVASFAATLPAHAEADLPLYGGLADGAGVPISRPNSADPGGLPGGAALAAQSQRFDAQRYYGGVNLGDSVAIEAAQRRPFGDASKPGEEALSLAGKLKVPLSDGLSLTGKMGLQYSGANGSLGGPDAAPVYGVGVAYELSQGLELRAESEHVPVRPGEPRNTIGDNLLFGARVRF